MFEFASTRCMQRTIDDSAVVGQDFAPVGEKLRRIVQTRAVSLQTGTEIDMHPVGVLSPQRWALLVRRIARSDRR